jgi:acetyltransferase-like isoleucine patch superfamily enzyme
VLRSVLTWAVRRHAQRRGRATLAYLHLCRPNGREYAEFIRKHGGLHAIGEHCSIQPHAVITDPQLVRLGNNVRLAGCKLIGHDGSVNMLNRAFGLKLDSVGAIDVGDNVFIGEDAIVLGRVTIGSNVIVAAGALVVKDVPSGWVVAGVPARPIGRLEQHIERLTARNAAWPWMELIAQRAGEYDQALEQRLCALRADYFFGTQAARDPAAAR